MTIIIGCSSTLHYINLAYAFAYAYALSLAQLVERASHVQRLCPRCGGPGVRVLAWAPFATCLSTSLILFPVISSAVLSIKPIKGQKIYIYLAYAADQSVVADTTLCTMTRYTVERCGHDVSIRPFDISACSSDGSQPFLAFDLLKQIRHSDDM